MASLIFNSTLAITEKYISSSDGTQIFAQAVGNPHLPSLVFVHGFALSALVWASIFRDTNLLRYFHMVAYDVRGFGQSGKPDKPESYASKFVADDYAAVTRAFNVTKPIFIGWSLGGSFVSDILQHYGEDALAGVICVASVPYFDLSPAVLTPWIREEILPALSNVDNATLALAARVDFTYALFTEPKNIPIEVLWSWLGSATVPEPSKIGHITSSVRGDTANTTNLFKAGANGLPLLFINGEKDKFVIGDEAVKLVDGKFKKLEVYTVKNGGHAMFYEDQDIFVGEVARFSRRVFKI
ncbi:Alpha/Beta hydrolase protein [Ephemerocybe angulata]|uniref:Alpha/Beta hydrolase protein n=1 Tax=Ephemerocybe angulata TaxID=980116 RepID=A0A8H6I6F1_9AGAR|nr:Alpha/Beta hydrolase protein [Tulosesus angulatus]